MARKSIGISKSEEEKMSPEKTNALFSRLDKITTRLDVEISILLDILFLNDKYVEPSSYTDKAAYLESLGLQIDEISKIVGRPSNWVSSRLRESKKRKSSKRQQRIRPKSGTEKVTDAD